MIKIKRLLCRILGCVKPDPQENHRVWFRWVRDPGTGHYYGAAACRRCGKLL